jgi:hypothetical protein
MFTLLSPNTLAPVIPVNTGIQNGAARHAHGVFQHWIPACAGMTAEKIVKQIANEGRS